MSTPIFIRKNRNNESVWYTSRYYTEILHQDILLRNCIKNILKERLNNIYLVRKNNQLDLIVYFNPYFNVSDRYIMLNLFKKYNISIYKLRTLFYKYNINLKIIKTSTLRLDTKGNIRNINILNIDNLSKLINSYIGYMLKKNIKNRRVFNIIEENIKTIINAMSRTDKKVIGYGVKCSGPFKRADRAETKWILQGKLPKNTIKTSSEYFYQNINTAYGSFGVKVWVCYR